MNDDENNPQPQAWIDPALEARIVASVLGETSAFEAAELERTVAETPELAIFKRRIEAVHALVGAAVKPENPRIQLSPERREKLLATLGVTAVKPPKKVTTFALPRPAWWSPSLLIRVAACVVMGAVFVTFLSSVALIKSSNEPADFSASDSKDGDFVGGEILYKSASESVDQFAGHDRISGEAKISALVAAAPPMESPMPQSSPQPLSPAPLDFAMSSARMEASKSPAMTQGGAFGSAEKFQDELLEAPAASAAVTSGNMRVAGQPDFVVMHKGGDAIIIAKEVPAEPSATPAGEALAKQSNVSAIPTFTGGWGHAKGGSGVTEVSKAQVTDSQFVEAKPVDWDGLYMYRGVNVLANDASPQPEAASAPARENAQMASNETVRDIVPMVGDIPVAGQLFRSESGGNKVVTPETESLTANVINQPIFSTRNGPVEFDGFVNYGSPISTLVPAKEAQAGQSQKLLEEAKNFSDSGRLDLAFKRYEETLKVDPANLEARRGMDQVNGARAEYSDLASNETRSRELWSVAKEWERPVRKDDMGQSSVVEQPNLSARGVAVINQKLDEIIIPKVDFKDVTVREALEFLNHRAKALDPTEGSDKKGVNVVLELPTDSAESEPRVTMELSQIPLRAAIEYVATAAGMKMKVEPYAVSMLPLSDSSESLATKEYNVPPGFLSDLSASDTRSGAKKFLEVSGVPFPLGASATHLASSNKLVVRNTVSNLELVDALIDTKLSVPEPVSQSAEIPTAKQPFSTFSLHVSDVSFQLAKDALAKGTVPDPARIRAEEFYNAFDYNDLAPASGEEVACRIEQSAHPFRQQRDLVRIALKVAAAGRAAGQPLRLTILLDTSGSMEREDRAVSVRRALQTLSTLLGPNDRVTLIGFARTPRLLAEQVPGDQAGKLVEIAKHTPSDGGTNLEAALALASELALKQKLPAAQNRIVLLTDGAANLGNADPSRLAQQIEKTRQQGISFDACGVGANGLNDGMLEALTRKGDGRYYFLNKPDDADAGFARQLAGALRPAAENVKVQVVFNPARVRQYRLIGFEEHLLRKEDFRNDKVQAAELSAEEAGVALYQVETLPEGEGELGQVFVRFRDPATGSMVERSWPMPFEAKARAFDQASPSMQLATTAALLAEKLRGDSQVDLDALAPVMNRLRGHYPDQSRVAELIQMVERARVTKP